MSVEKRKKLNQLQRLLPEGLLADTRWLESKGYSSALLSLYAARGWLEHPARGIYRRPGGMLLWQHVVVSLQSLLTLPVSVGGRSALELGGLSHYVSAQGLREAHLYSHRRLPGWVGKLDLEVRFGVHTGKGLFRTALDSAPGRWNPADQSFSSGELPRTLTRTRWGQWNWPLILSSPERAILEFLHEVPERETFDQADKFMEGLRTLSPHRVQTLLEDCRNIKVKRLFFWFAERHEPAWLKKIDRDRIDLGKGKRMIVRGGRLDTHYLITVPESLDGSE